MTALPQSRYCTWLVLAAFAITLGACSRSDPERELRANVLAMAQAVEQRDPAAFLNFVSDDFTRESGGFGKQELKRALLGVILRNEKITVSAVVTNVRLEGDRAHATVRVITTGGAGLLPERAQGWEFDSLWRRENGRWQVFNAEWRDAS